ncbi:MAG: hypothetical protein ABW346_09025 [Terrimicrobium sp.]
MYRTTIGGAHACRISRSAVGFLIAAPGFSTLIERESLASGCARHMCGDGWFWHTIFLLIAAERSNHRKPEAL